MNKKNFKKIKNSIKEKQDNNSNLIYELSSKIYFLKESSLDNKLSNIIAFSAIPFIVISGLLPVYMSANIPTFIYFLIITIIPITFGTITNNYLNKKNGLCDKLKSFSNAKNEEEKIEEATRYIIEREKLKNENEVLKQTNDKLYIDIKNVDTDIDKLNESIKEKQKNLDILSTKVTLTKEFGDIRHKNKVNDFSTKTLVCLIGMYICLAVYNMPIYIANKVRNFNIKKSISTMLLEIIAPSIIGGIISIKYYNKKRKNRINAFKKINNELEDEKLDEVITYNNYNDYREKINKSINELSDLKLQLEVAKQELIRDSYIKNIDTLTNDISGRKIDINKSLIKKIDE